MQYRLFIDPILYSKFILSRKRKKYFNSREQGILLRLLLGVSI